MTLGWGIDGYDARLIAESEHISSYSWMNDSDYYYLTMTLPDSDSVKVVHKSGQIWGYDIISYMGEVRPVINIYKSAIQN